MKSIRLLGALFACSSLTAPALAAEPAAVVKTYADLAEAVYSDSLSTARSLREAVGALTASPSAETLAAARAAWLAARVPYQQSEAWRFGNPSSTTGRAR